MTTAAHPDGVELPYRYRWPRPAVTVDCLVYTMDQGEPWILLIKRKNDPFKGAWALPGQLPLLRVSIIGRLSVGLDSNPLGMTPLQPVEQSLSCLALRQRRGGRSDGRMERGGVQRSFFTLAQTPSPEPYLCVLAPTVGMSPESRGSWRARAVKPRTARALCSRCSTPGIIQYPIPRRV